MKTSNEKWHGNSKPKSNAGAGRDGKSFEKRDVKSILKGSKGGVSKFNSGKSSYDEKQPRNSEFNRNENSRPSYGNNRPYDNDDNSRPVFTPKKSFESRGDKPAFRERKPYENRDNQSSFRPRKPWEERDNQSSFRPRKPWEDREGKPAYGEKRYGENKYGENRQGRTYRNQDNNDQRTGKLSFRKPGDIQKTEFIETRFDNKKDGVTFRKPYRKNDNYDPNSKYSNKKQLEFRKATVDLTKPVRLNKFLANAGICSRREADEYIQAGVISVNGQIITEMGVKILPTDKVMFHDQTVRSERKVYILLNKPKDCVTTAEDTHDRLTVLDLVKNACSERIYPVGRLDRNTTGVLLLTNDGDLASKLTHPKFEKKKIYHVTLDKPLEEEDYKTVLAGVTLDDINIAADALEFVKEGDLKQVGIEIHSGQNRVVRRIFEKLGYKIIRLDRVFFAGLTKKNLARGKYRFLNDREINMLRMGAYE